MSTNSSLEMATESQDIFSASVKVGCETTSPFVYNLIPKPAINVHITKFTLSTVNVDHRFLGSCGG